MNAYELANELQELDSKLHLINLFKSANMLRQQADRIEKLELYLKASQEARIEDGKYQADRIAELEEEKKHLQKENRDYRTWCDSLVKATPQTKPLSDEEIMELYKKSMESPYTHQQSYFGFARAIEERILGK